MKIEYRLSRRLGWGGGEGAGGGGLVVEGGGGEAYAASKTTMLHMKTLNQTESPIFVILCVLCSQKRSLTFIINKILCVSTCVFEILFGREKHIVCDISCNVCKYCPDAIFLCYPTSVSV